MPRESASPLTFGQLLRHYRRRAGLTQVELADRAELTASAISALERGIRTHPYPYTMRQLADGLNLTGSERADLLGSAQQARIVEPEPGRPETGTVVTSARGAVSVPATPLIGRSSEMAALRARLSAPTDKRLLTLAGFAGIGKTRLALHLAMEAATDFPDGIWFVQLAPLDEAEQVATVVALTLDLREAPDEPLVERIIAFLGSRHALLVLDNCEHVLSGCAELADQLLRACPDLRIIATSRTPLHIAGEQIWRIHPLETPQTDRALTIEQLAAIPAIQLFVNRAEVIVPQFELTEHNADAIADICVRLSGVPLAIELTAALLRVLSIEQVTTRLADVLAVESGKRTGTPSRHQSVRAALEWSYSLLSAPEQRLFERLAIFRGGCDLESAEAVCAGDDLPIRQVLGLLPQLVDQSLIQVDRSGPVTRYYLLEPVRLFADERLAASGDRHIVAARHAAAFTALALRSAPELNGPEQVDWLLKLDRDTENMHAALRWLSEQPDMTTEGLRLAVALAPFWSVRSYLSEGRRRLNPLLARRDESVPLPLRMAGLLRSGELAQWQALLDEALETLNACCRLAEQLDDQRTLAEALIWLGIVKRRQGDIRAARDVTEAGLAIAQRLDDRQVIAFGLLNLGVTLVYAEELASGLAALDDSLALYRSLGNTRFVAIVATMRGGAANVATDYTRAADLFREGLAGLVTVGDRAFTLSNLRMVASLIAERQPEDAAQLIGAAYTLRETLKAKADLLGERTNEATISTIRNQLSSARIDAAISSGYMLTIEQAQSTAMAALDRLSAMLAADPDLPTAL